MSISQPLISELESQSKSTRKLMERVPMEKADWKPHEKSTSLGRLAIHVAELPGWIPTLLNSDEIDFAKFDYKPTPAATTNDLVKIFEENLTKALTALKNAKDEDFKKTWTMRNGEKIFFTLPKDALVRDFAFNHLYHHRGQLTVYLRLNDVPLPNVFGPTADEPM